MLCYRQSASLRRTNTKTGGSGFKSNCRSIIRFSLNSSQNCFKPVLKTPNEIYNLCLEANSSPNCIGLITWMHTFSPAKMWNAGLKILNKPFVHFHTQFNRLIPRTNIDMNFMNLNQSAHGGWEFGFICTRLKLNRKAVVGYWQDDDVQHELATWFRAACAWHDSQNVRIIEKN